MAKAKQQQSAGTKATGPVELPQLVVLDTNSLIIGGWPKPNSKLVYLVEWLRKFGIEVVVPQAVLREREGQLKREMAQQLREAHPHVEDLKRLGAQGDLTFPDLETLVEQKQQESRTAVEQLALGVLAYPRRTLDEVFEYAIDEEPPFREKGTGFKDAVILLSAVEAAAARNVSRVWLISSDRDFQNTRKICGGLNVKAVKFDDALNALQHADDQLADEAVRRIVAESSERFSKAKTAIHSAGSQIAQQASELYIPSSVVGYSGDNRVEKVTFESVSGVTLEPAFNDVAEGDRVKFAANVRLTAHVLSYDEIHRSWPVGITLGQMLRRSLENAAIEAALAEPSEPKIVERSFSAFVTGTLRRSADAYDDVQVEDIKIPLDGPMSALLNLAPGDA